MFNKSLQIKKYLNPKNFEDLFVGYVVFCTLLSIFIPENFNYFHAFIAPLLDVMGNIFPGIESLARQSKTPLAIKTYYSFQWLIFPYFFYKVFEIIKPDNSKKITAISRIKTIQLIFYMIFIFCIAVLSIYMLAFHVHVPKEIITPIPPGRGEGVAMALSNKYTAGLTSSILHFTVAIGLSAPILAIRKYHTNRRIKKFSKTPDPQHPKLHHHSEY